MMDIFYACLAAIVVAMVIGYACIRGIDFLFTKREDERRYRYNKSYIRYYFKGGKQMLESTSRTINQNLLNMFKGMGDL